MHICGTNIVIFFFFLQFLSLEKKYTDTKSDYIS